MRMTGLQLHKFSVVRFIYNALDCDLVCSCKSILFFSVLETTPELSTTTVKLCCIEFSFRFVHLDFLTTD